MELSVICFTRKGYEKADILRRVGVYGVDIRVFCKCEALKEECIDYTPESLEEWAFKCVNSREAMLFIGAAGIAVRTIAPYLKSKLTDSPVIVMDDAARFVIPLISGHVGGANELAAKIAAAFGAECVITTSTDVNNVFAIDNFAMKNHLGIINKDGIAKVSAKLLDGEAITIGIDDGIEIDKESYDAFLKSGKGNVRIVEKDFFGKQDACLDEECYSQKPDVWIGDPDERSDALLYLYPKIIALGIGCKKGKTAEEISKFVFDRLSCAGIARDDIFCAASIDVKKDEEGLVSFAAKNRFEFATFSAEELESIEGNFAESDFVRNTVGTGSVAERAAVAASGNGELVMRKQAENGVTVAAAKRKIRLRF